MLNAYKKVCYYKIDNDDWQEVYNTIFANNIVLKDCDENTTTEIVIDSVSWQYLYNMLDYNTYNQDGISIDTTLFTNKPFIWINNIKYMKDSFNKISIKNEYTKKDITLEYLFKNIDANTAVKYITERL